MTALPDPTFSGPPNSETAVLRSAGKLSRPVYCICPSALCRGPSSSDWLSCDLECKPCNPPPPRRTREAEDPS